MRRERREGIYNIIAILGIPVFSLLFLNVYIPNIMSKSDFADWRLASSLIAFSGILHLGAADGLYRTWLSGNGNIKIDFGAMLTVIIYVLVLSIASSLIAESVFSLSALNALSLGFAVFISALMSFSIYYCQVHLAGNVLRLSLVIQPVSFMATVYIISLLARPTSSLVIVSYGISCLLPSLLALANKPLEIKGLNPWQETRRWLVLGAPILLTNIWVIVFINYDKIFLRGLISSKIVYSDYALQSSLFVASSGLGLSLGSFFVSRRIELIRSKWRGIIVCLPVLLSLILAMPLSNIMVLLIPRYSLDYRAVIVLSILSFGFMFVYVAYSKIYMTKELSLIMLFFLPLYSLAIIVSRLLAITEIGYISYASIGLYIIVAIFVLELRLKWRDKKKELL